jgi:hypothetical protein
MKLIGAFLIALLTCLPASAVTTFTFSLLTTDGTLLTPSGTGRVVFSDAPQDGTFDFDVAPFGDESALQLVVQYGSVSVDTTRPSTFNSRQELGRVQVAGGVPVAVFGGGATFESADVFFFASLSLQGTSFSYSRTFFESVPSGRSGTSNGLIVFDQVSTVPEPETYALLLVGLAITQIATARRTKRRETLRDSSALQAGTAPAREDGGCCLS